MFGRFEGTGGLIAFFRASRWLPAGYVGPVAIDDLAGLIAPAASVDPLSAAFHAAPRPVYIDDDYPTEFTQQP